MLPWHQAGRGETPGHGKRVADTRDTDGLGTRRQRGCSTEGPRLSHHRPEAAATTRPAEAVQEPDPDAPPFPFPAIFSRLSTQPGSAAFPLQLPRAISGRSCRRGSLPRLAVPTRLCADPREAAEQPRTRPRRWITRSPNRRCLPSATEQRPGSASVPPHAGYSDSDAAAPTESRERAPSPPRTPARGPTLLFQGYFFFYSTQFSSSPSAHTTQTLPSSDRRAHPEGYGSSSLPAGPAPRFYPHGTDTGWERPSGSSPAAALRTPTAPRAPRPAEGGCAGR